MVVVLLFFFLGSEAQKREIIYDFSDEFEKVDTIKFNLSQTTTDTSLFILESEAWDVVRTLQSKSYLAAQLDSVSMSENTVRFHIYLGHKLKIGALTWVGIQDEWLKHPALRKLDLSGKPVNSREINYILTTLLQQLEEYGYPLARIRIVEKQVRHDSLFATIKVEPGDYVEFVSIEQDSVDVISNAFLQRYLDIQEGQPFRMSKIKSIERSISALPYMALAGSPQIKILTGKAYVNLKMKETPASRFDFLIGVLPNVGEERQFTISGELTADFKNKFKQGEELFLHIQQLKPESQRLDFSATYPYLLNLPFGVHGEFALYKNGTISRDLNAETGVQYRSGKNLQSRFFINYQSSRLIDVDTLAVKNAMKLPAAQDVRSNNIGVRLISDFRDYKFNPRQGLFAEVKITAGIRSTLPNAQVTNLRTESTDFSTAYDSLDLSIFQASLRADIEYFIPLRKLSTFKIANQTGVKWNQADVFLNEYYRIGGSNILRGFDEESITAQYYSVFTAEYRYLLSLNSYFSVFCDYGFLYNEFRESNNWDQPIGFGLGLSFQTNAGIFGIDVAVGREQRNAIDFRNAKTHFGFISLF